LCRQIRKTAVLHGKNEASGLIKDALLVAAGKRSSVGGGFFASPPPRNEEKRGEGT